MPYGTIKVDNITFTNGGVDTTITVSGLAASTTGDLTVTGTISGAIVRATTISGGVATITSGVFALGSAAAPSISFSGDPNNGIYSPGADQVAISTNGTGRLFVTSAGLVGIGETTPVAKLHARTDNAGSGSTPLLIQNRSVSANTAVGISFAPNTSDTADRSAVIYGVNSSGGSGNGTDLTFHTNANGSAPTEKVRITSAGLMGVGTAAPATNLDIVVGAGTATQKLGSSSVAGGSYLNLHGASASKTWFIGANYNLAGVLEFTQSTANGGTTPSSTPAMVLSAAGNVGIGTTSPAYSLDVQPTGLGLARVGSQDNQAGIYISSGNAASPFINFLTSTNTLRATIYAGASSDDLIFGTGASGTERFRIGSAGQLGIGGANYGTSGQVLTSAGSGAAPSWTTVGGAGSLGDGSASAPSLAFSADTNTGLFRPGSDTLAITTGGSERARIDSSGRLLIGISSPTGANLLQVNSDASIYGLTVGRGGGNSVFNAALGASCLANNSSGNYNVAIGYAALLSNTGGSENIAIGYSALLSNTAGYHNTAVGARALLANSSGNYNVAIGNDALVQNTNGTYNTSIGYYALYNVTTTGGNVGVGSFAGSNITTGYGNTAIGFTALSSVTTGGGNIGIGGVNSSSSQTPVFTITTQNDRVVMGTTSVTNAYIQVAWTVVSDARDKTNFGSVPHGLKFVKQLNPVSFQFKKNRESDEPNGPIRYGFKAQDILALEGDDNAVIIDNEDPEKLRYNGEALVPVLVNAIKEQQALIENLRTRLDAAGI